ncbi:hypothetical protein BG000_007156, partial [Podila horticola]
YLLPDESDDPGGSDDFKSGNDDGDSGDDESSDDDANLGSNEGGTSGTGTESED